MSTLLGLRSVQKPKTNGNARNTNTRRHGQPVWSMKLQGPDGRGGSERRGTTTANLDDVDCCRGELGGPPRQTGRCLARKLTLAVGLGQRGSVVLASVNPRHELEVCSSAFRRPSLLETGSYKQKQLLCVSVHAKLELTSLYRTSSFSESGCLGNAGGNPLTQGNLLTRTALWSGAADRGCIAGHRLKLE